MNTPLHSVRLAAWGTAWLAGRVTLPDVIAAVVGPDEPHELIDARLPQDEPGLDGLLLALADAGTRGLRVALPAPGDPLGLTGPAELTRAAIDAGQAVISVGARDWDGAEVAVVPEVLLFGPPGDEGCRVRWRWYPASNIAPPPVTLREAERDLTTAMAAASDALQRLGSTDWRAQAQDEAEDLRRHGRRPRELLPPSIAPRAARVLARAITVRDIVRAATGDDGGSITAYGAQARRLALEPLDRACRRAMVAAAESSLEPARP